MVGRDKKMGGWTSTKRSKSGNKASNQESEVRNQGSEVRGKGISNLKFEDLRAGHPRKS
jgi:hypothetical protein